LKLRKLHSVKFFLIETLMAVLCVAGIAVSAAAQDSKVMGEVQFEGASKVEKDSGVWVDGGYVGYLKELKGNKKVLLLPGEHVITVRQSGYDDFEQKIVVEPRQTQLVQVVLHLSPRAEVPAVTATLKVTVQPGRAAVFLDGRYVGHASEFGGATHSMLIGVGKHQIRVELPGYRTFETSVDLLPGQKSEVRRSWRRGVSSRPVRRLSRRSSASRDGKC